MRQNLLKRAEKYICVITLLLYLVIIYKATVFDRLPTIDANYNLIPFWSYADVIVRGNVTLGIQIVLNILMFVPIGYLIAEITKKHGCKLVWILLFSAGLSLLIESGQLYFHTGLCEWDDIFDNVFGCFVGYKGYAIVFKNMELFFKSNRQYKIFNLVICIGVICGGMFFYQKNMSKLTTAGSVEYVIQLESVKCESVYSLTGYCFVAENENKDHSYELYLKDVNEDKLLPLKQMDHLQRQDVNNYYAGCNSYEDSGFVAEIGTENINNNVVYELMIKWKDIPMESTGFYLKNEVISRVNPDMVEVPDVFGTDLDTIVEEGMLLAYNSKYTFYVYQYQNKLYWMIDNKCDLDFESLKIPMLIWTTQIEKLPEKMLKLGAVRDSRGGLFTKGEITSEINCGNYRVRAEDLPLEYPITVISTGLYMNNKWIWNSFCRPQIEL